LSEVSKHVRECNSQLLLSNIPARVNGLSLLGDISTSGVVEEEPSVDILVIVENELFIGLNSEALIKFNLSGISTVGVDFRNISHSRLKSGVPPVSHMVERNASLSFLKSAAH